MLGQAQPGGLAHVGGVGPAEALAPGDAPHQPLVLADEGVPRVSLAFESLPHDGGCVELLGLEHQKKILRLLYQERASMLLLPSAWGGRD